MRILFVNRMVSMERGGGETFDLEMARHLAKRGCGISFLSGIPLFGRPAIPMAKSQSPISSFTLRSPYFGWFPWDKVKGGWRLRVADFRMFERRATAWLSTRQGNYDLVQVCELPSFVAGAKRNGIRLPMVIRLTAPNFFNPEHGIEKADAVIASGMTIEQLQSEGAFECTDIPNAVDTDLFCPGESDFRVKAGVAADEVVFLYVARFQDFKNHGLLLRAFASFLSARPRARLVFVGGGPLQRKFVQETVVLGVSDKVLFLGEVSYSELPAIYRAADIKVISSDFESFCFAALEAMATGLPIITTDCGWVPRLLGQGAGGRVVPVKDVAALAKAMQALADRAVLRKEMGERNRRQAVAEHGWAASAQKLFGLYETLLSKGPVPGV